MYGLSWGTAALTASAVCGSIEISPCEGIWGHILMAPFLFV
jgi:hypothetical protein